MSTEKGNLQSQIWKLREELADARVKLGGLADLLAEALEDAKHWRMLYHATLVLDDTEVVDES